MKIAVEGCAHGELETIYSVLENIQRRDNIKIDLLLCCGDFQAVRNEVDLACMAVPLKYREMCSFYKYYSGEKKAPILTIFIGGNHEASNHLWELPFGGWVAPNIYYLGYSGVVNFGGLRIAGLSGIFKSHDYNKGHYEAPPFDQGTVRSIYHVRSLDVFKLKLLTRPVDIAMSHDWPKGVYHYGNLNELYRWKGFLRPEIENDTLGSYAAQEVLKSLQPDFWFSAHLHCRFPAQVTHSQTGKVTNFLALDKCLPRRKYLEVIDVGPPKGPMELSYDPEWLAITKSTLPLFNTEPGNTKLPFRESIVMSLKPNVEAIKAVQELFEGDLRIPENFTQNVPLYNPDRHQKHVQVTAEKNPQTDIFCQRLRIRNPFWATDISGDKNPDEISLSDEGEDDDLEARDYPSSIQASLPHTESGRGKVSSGNPDEISVSDEDKLSDNLAVCLPALLHTSAQVALPSSNPDEIGLADDKESESQFSDFPVPLPPKLNPCSSLAKEPETNGKGEEVAKIEGRRSDSEPPRKMFKLVRRNQNMYSTIEDSDEEKP
ncbi:lariat debranching enzyme-like [Dendronephthya gigantea]|uniref:lariat debranching enzyme-like n=1 Tax=Dendronephthya gigantea TaxID=151771 RepID=UPI00106BFA06|nr:lariat debranching enzyme-like [Dendronephthya gigantea]